VVGGLRWYMLTFSRAYTRTQVLRTADPADIGDDSQERPVPFEPEMSQSQMSALHTSTSTYSESPLVCATGESHSRKRLPS
jgi:hypothetical protein